MEIYLVFVDAIQNSNKFWAAIVEDGNLTVQWGRVGYQAQTKVHTLDISKIVTFYGKRTLESFLDTET
ncbi:hypothetical protein A6769_29810 [Nostoc punctiforme NIES-2108]|uniref:WGR domain-containing protein n=1 Tax=Nostoc punctiforme NIES-2108 TaxID=1356359 RepID=A0A367R5J6_NOSPU|nr:hypothetical protein A6769_29810 [Nostoc punctiforme NIES-2108]